MKIHLLSPLTISKIATGEVIDRPLSVVKELLENAIDANATEININIQRGGRSLIYVSDNGTGIDGDDLLLATDNLATIYRHKSIYDKIWKDEGEHGILYKPYIIKEEWVK